MNGTLIANFWRQRLTSPARVLLLLFLFSMPLLLTAAMPQAAFAVLDNVMPLAMVIAVGMIGQDIASGVLQLVFARPVTRWEYVTSRWIAAGFGAAIVVLVQVAIAWALMSARGASPGAANMAAFAAVSVERVVGIAAVMALLSTIAPQFGDFVLYLLLSLFATLLSIAGQAKGWAVATRSGAILQGVLTPSMPPGQLTGDGLTAALTIVSYLATIAVCLTLAIVVLNRRELSYATG